MIKQELEKNGNKFTIITAKDLGFELVANSNLSTHYSANPEGDWVGLSAVLRMILEETGIDNDLHILEVGTAHGHFLRSFYEFLEKEKNWQTYAVGVDSKLHGYCPCMFVENMKFVDGSSTDTNTINQFEDNKFDFVFIDGCHCSKHAELDAKNYASKVKVGGYLGFHDSSPTFQGGSEQPRAPDCAEDTHIGVVKGIESSQIKENGFEFFLEEYHTDDKYYGGVTVFKRVK
jgi:hypothetical protein